MTLLYVEKNSGNIGNADNLVIATAEQFDDYVALHYGQGNLNELSDSELSDTAENTASFGESLTLGQLRDFLMEVRDNKGDWRGNLDYYIDFLSL